MDEPVPRGAGLPAELDHAGDEHRPDRRDRDDGLLGLVLKRLGWRTTMTIGIAAHASRFFIYAIGEPLWLMVASNVVHGLCYAFFFAAVYIFVDEYFPKDSARAPRGCSTC